MERERGKMVLFIVFVGSLRDTTLVTTLLPVSTSQERRRGGRGTSGGPVSRAESKESWTEHLVLFHASEISYQLAISLPHLSWGFVVYVWMNPYL